MRLLAIIPARGGSKGIPRKNLVPLCGKPLIQYTVEAAQKSRFIDKILLSSEDNEIIQFCRSLGIYSPYVRPSCLAQDTSGMMEVIMDALDWVIKDEGVAPDNIILLQPSSPLRTERHIDESFDLFQSKRVGSLISVHRMFEHPYECLKISEREWSYLSEPPNKVERRQDYDEAFYYINGALYLASTETLKNEATFVVKENTEFYYMDQICGIDIDEPIDLIKAESYLKYLNEKN